MIEVLRINCKIKIYNEIDAIITGILIRANQHITYECSWIDSKTHNCEWLERSEIEPVSLSDNKVKIGFKKDEQQ